MTRRTSFFALILGAVLSLALAACGATSNSPGSGGLYGSSGSTPTTAASGQNSAQVATNTATVAGTSESVLTNAQGMTLYYFKLDTAQTAACTSSGGCNSFWPPLLDTSGTPTSSGSLPGKLAVLNDANGMQVTYNGHPLYTFSEDKAPGDTKGEGFMNEWHVATPTLAVLTGGSTAPQPTATGYGYGYGG